MTTKLQLTAFVNAVRKFQTSTVNGKYSRYGFRDSIMHKKEHAQDVSFLIFKRFRSKPHISRPRENQKTWTRRCFEQAMKPTFDQVELNLDQKCTIVSERLKVIEETTFILPEDRALANTIKLELRNAQILAVCQRLPVDERHMHLDRMEMQHACLGTRIVTPRIMNLVIENSSLSNLSPVFAGDLMILWADDLDSAKLILKSTKKHRWLILLACSVEGHLLSSEQFTWYVDNQTNILDQHVKLVSSFNSPTSTLLQSLTHYTTGLTGILSYRIDELKKAEGVN